MSQGQQIALLSVESPCVGVCESGLKGLCVGCGRSREERMHFNSLPNDVKDLVVRTSGLRLRRMNYLRQRAIQIAELEALPDDGQMNLF